MSAEQEALVRRLLESASQQGLSIDLASAPGDPAALLAWLHDAAQGEALPETVAELVAALAAALRRP